MPDRLISAEKLINYINGSIEAMTKVEVAVDGEYLWGLINYAIENAPTVDAVEVVRCKDCEYLTIINEEPIYACCSKHNHIFYPWEEDIRKHFCSWGERKEDGNS